MGLYQIFQRTFGLFRRLFHRILSHFAKRDPISPKGIRFRQKGSDFAKGVLFRQKGPDFAKRDQISPKGIRFRQKGSDFAKRGPISPKGIRFRQKGSDFAKRSSFSLKGVPFCRNRFSLRKKQANRVNERFILQEVYAFFMVCRYL